VTTLKCKLEYTFIIIDNNTFYFCQSSTIDNYSACKIVLAKLYVLGVTDCKTTRLHITEMQVHDFLSFGQELQTQPYEQMQDGKNQAI